MRLSVVLILVALNLSSAFPQAANITGWRHADLVYCAGEEADTIQGDSPPGKNFFFNGKNYDETTVITELAKGVVIFHPALAGPGVHTIKYGDIGSNNVTVNVTVSSLPAVTLAAFANVCINAPAFSLFNADSSNVSPKNGVFSGPGVNASGVFSPLAAGVGTHTIVYTVAVGACNSSASRTITVLPQPVVTLNLFPTVCEGTSAFMLTQGTPAGGIYSGPGVGVGGLFDPATAGIGSHAITYTYSNGGCASTDTENLTVFALTPVSFAGLGARYCLADPVVNLNGVPAGAGGVFSGPGIANTGPGTATFDPASAGLGLHEIVFTYTDANSCINADTQFVQVGTPLSIAGLSSGYCINSVPVGIVGSPLGGSYGVLAGLTDNGDGTATFDPAIAGVGLHTIVYTYTDAFGCINSINQTIRVYDLPSPFINNLLAGYCINNAPIVVTGNYAPSGSFSGAGIFDLGNGTARFSPALLTGGNTYSIQYRYTDPVSTCQNTITRNVVIYSSPTAELTGNADICTGQNAPLTINFTGNAPYHIIYTDGISNVAINNIAVSPFSFNVSPVDSAVYRIASVTDNNGCASTGTDSATVNVIPLTSLVMQPVSQTVCEGASLQFRVGASGTNLTYQWYKDGVAIPGANNAVIGINNAQLPDAGRYSCQVSGSCGVPVMSDEARLDFWQPVNLTLNPVSNHLCEGGALTLTAGAIGSVTDYQWKLNNIALSDTGAYSGAHTNSLFISSVGIAYSGNYTCTVTGVCDSVTTLPGTLTIDPSIIISSHPTDQVLCLGANAQFRVIATGNNLSYQWQKGGVDIPFATAVVYSILNIDVVHTGDYRCKITSPCGEVVYSNYGHLTVNQPATISSQPSSISVCAGDVAIFHVAASGTGIGYQWYQGTLPLADGGRISGTTTSALTLSGTLAIDAGEYWCKITGLCNVLDSDPALLKVTDQLLITNQPSSDSVCIGGTAVFSISAAGGAALSYQWQFNDIDIPGEESSTLVVNNVSLMHIGNYRCVVSNTCGQTVNSVRVNLTILEPLQIIQSPDSLLLCAGSNATFRVEATGSGLMYQWEKDGIPISEAGKVSGTQSNILVLQNIDTTLAGVYNCFVTGACLPSRRSDHATLDVLERVSISEQPKGDTLCLGENTMMRITATGAVKYQWQKDDVDLAGENSNVLMLNNATNADSGVYRCLVFGLCDTLASDGAEIVFVTDPLIVQHPLSDTACEGTTIHLDIRLDRDAYSWQWKKDGLPLIDGANISGSNSNSLTISSLSIMNSGLYSVDFITGCGLRSSNAAILTVIDDFILDVQPTSDTICTGLNHTFRTQASIAGVSYQWQKDGVDIPGANSQVITITNCSNADIGVYRCMVVGGCKAIASDEAILMVTESINIFASPVNASICLGSAHTFSVGVTGVVDQFRWLFKGLPVTDGADFSGASTANLTIRNATPAFSGGYQCEVSGLCGPVQYSSSASLTVYDSTKILVSPANRSVCEGETVVLSCEASGNNLGYQWSKDGIPLVGEISSILWIDTILPAQAGIYNCTVSGSCGTIGWADATLTVGSTIVIDSQPVAFQQICVGNDVTLSVSATGSDLSYQWFKDAVAILGAESNILDLDDIVGTDAGLYYCRVLNGCDTVYTTHSVLEAYETVTILEQPVNATVCLGSAAFFTVNATGESLTYQWQKGTVSIPGENSPVMQFTNVSYADTGVYRCLISSICGNTYSIPVSLSAFENTTIISQPVPMEQQCTGSDILLSVLAQGATLNYQWQKNNSNISPDLRISGVNSPNLQIADLEESDNGIYQCIVTGTCGTQNSHISQVQALLGPSVIIHPVNISVVEGETGSFRVLASGDSLQYQWYHNGVPLTDGPNVQGSDSSDLLLQGATSANEGVYYVAIQGHCGNVISTSARLTLLPYSVITMHPSDESKCTGESVALQTFVTPGTHTFRWQKDGSNLTEGGRFTGTFSPSLTITNLTSLDIGAYQCVIDDIELSQPAYLYVSSPVIVSRQPLSQSTCLGNNIVFYTEALGDSLTYQWYKGSVTLSDDLVYSGTDSPLLSVSIDDLSVSGNYSCAISGTCNSTNTEVAVLSVSQPLVIAPLPASDTLCEGQTLNLQVNALGSVLTYRWMKGANTLVDGLKVSGADSPVLTITDVSEEDAGVYYCIIYGVCDTLTTTLFQLETELQPVVITHPTPVETCENEDVFMMITHSGTAVSYQWQKDGANIVDGLHFLGSNSPVLEIQDAIPSLNGNYQCLIYGSCDTVISNVATLNVTTPLGIVSHPISDTLCQGSSTSLTIGIAGTAESFSWHRNGFAISDNGFYAGTSSSTLLLFNGQPSLSGNYYCEASNRCGSASSNMAFIKVDSTTVVLSVPQTDVLCQGSGVVLRVEAEGADLQYQWTSNNLPVANDAKLSGANASVLQISNIDNSYQGIYRCKVTGRCGTVSGAPMELIIKNPPVIVLQPDSLTQLCQGDTLILNLLVVGDSLSYQWRRNGLPLLNGMGVSGARTPNLLIDGLEVTMGDIYDCLVSNGCVQISSNPSLVTVNEKVQITDQPVGRTVCSGESVSLYLNVSGDPLSYQWQKGTVNLTNGGQFSGVDEAMLIISNTNSTDEGAYRCVIRDKCGNEIISNTTLLYVENKVNIINQPLGDTLCEGENIILTIPYSGDATSFQWYRTLTSLTDNPELSGTSTANLSFTNISSSSSGYYHCMITGSCGDIKSTSIIPVLVNKPIQIIRQPVNISTCEGATAVFSIDAVGDSITYQWQKDGLDLVDGGNISGSTSSLLIVNNLTNSMTGSYQCVVRGACDTLASFPASLEVGQFPVAAGPVTGPVTVCQRDENIIYSVADIAYADWYKWTLPPGAVIVSGDSTRQITVNFLEHETGGTIWVAGINGCGTGVMSPVLNIVANDFPMAYAGIDRIVCNSTSTVSANPVDATSAGSWRVLSGPAVIDNPNLASTGVNGLRYGDNLFVWTVDRLGCINSDTVNIRNNSLVVDAGDDVTICSHIHYMNATAPAEGEGSWIVAEGFGTNITSSDPHTLVTGLSKGRNVFVWEVYNNGCFSYDTVVIVNDSPSEPNAGADQRILSDFTNLNATIPHIGEGRWSLLNGSANISDPLAYNTLVTNLGKSKNIFRWLVTHNGCALADTVIVENIIVDTTDAGPNQVVCSSSTILNARNPYPGIGEWSVKRGAGVFSNVSAYRTTVYNLGRGENVFVWTVTLGGTTSDSVIIINNSPTTANAGYAQTQCSDTTRLSANNPTIGIGTWSVVGGSGNFDNIHQYNTIVRSMANGNNTYKWEIRNAGCTSSAIVTITNNKPTSAYAGEDVSTCESSQLLNPNTPTFGTGEWSIGSGSASFSGNLATTLARGQNHLIYTIRNGLCWSSDTVVVTSNRPSTANAGADVSICRDYYTLTGNTPVFGTGTWTIQSGSGIVAFPTNPASTISSLGMGANHLRWEIDYNGCKSADFVVVSNDWVQANAGPDQTLCQNFTVLEGNDPGLSEGTWSIIGTGTGANIAAPNQPNSPVANLSQGVNVLRWTISKNSCTSFDEVTIINNLPTPAFAGSDKSICNNSIALNASPVYIGTGEWTLISGSGTILQSSLRTSTVNNLGLGANVFRWTTSNASCNSYDEVTINNNLPVNVFAGDDQVLCVDTTLVQATPATLGIGRWSVVAGSGTFVDDKQFSTIVRGLAKDLNIFVWTVSTASCSVSDTVKITNNNPTKAIAGADQIVCNSRATLNANIVTHGDGRWALVSGAGEISNVEHFISDVSGLALGLNRFRWTISKSGCVSFDEIDITNNSPAIATAANDMVVCGDSAVIYAVAPTVGKGYWQVISGGGNFADSLAFSTLIQRLPFGNTVIRWTTTNGICQTYDDVLITNNKLNVNAGEDVTVYDSFVNLSGNNPESGYGTWTVSAGYGEFQTPNYFSTLVNDLAPGLNTFTWNVTNGDCISSDDVGVLYKPMPEVNFSANVLNGCPSLEVRFTNSTKYGANYQWDFGDGATSNQTNPVHVFDRPGNYAVTLSAFGPDGRVAVQNSTITVYDPPIADFIFAPDSVYVNQLLHCYDLSVNGHLYHWDFGDGNSSTEQNPMHIYEEVGEQVITLRLYSRNSCLDSISKIVRVLEDGVLIFPNTFTPSELGGGGVYDPLDKSNDVFYPYAENVTEYQLKIYNRWGVLLFESNDLNKGWDGTYRGQPANKGVYVWKATGRYTSGRGFIKTGSVLLYR